MVPEKWEIEVNHGDDLEMIRWRWSVPEGSDGTGIYNVLVNGVGSVASPLQNLNLRQYPSEEMMFLDSLLTSRVLRVRWTHPPSNACRKVEVAKIMIWRPCQRKPFIAGLYASVYA